MAVPRPVLLAVLGLALIAATLVVTRSSSQSTAITPAPQPVAKPPVRTPAPAKPAAPAPRAKAPVAPAKPAPPSPADAQAEAVTDAYGRGDTVVLFFTQPGSADDDADAASVATIGHAPHVSVFRAGLADVTTYRSLLANVGVAQTPTLVVLRSGKQARVIEGYVDPQSLRQTIADLGG